MVIVEEIGDWMRGYKISHPDNLGIFPACYIHVRQRRNLRIIEEATAVVDEWSKLYFHLFKQKQSAEIMRKQTELR